ncbi:unnamed protein product [Spirodela intermedia]|uniref:Uncharacterized protein n=1 Tax=Spirodela intermedia TaxID=51605 RepID=A0A7I8JTK2_SPIIN|nr:unnamed protein product [Spirodela intermedia]CAA6672943.1 unnamed protein product [Spirodela intermedia]
MFGRIVVQCPRPRRLSLDKDDRKNGNFAALRRLSPDGEELDGGGAHVRESFILRSVQQEEALHRIYNAPRIALTRFSPMIQRFWLLNPSAAICRKVAIIR